MKITLVSYHYAPEITPRAFRATSIYETLVSKGFEVELIIPPCTKTGVESERSSSVFRSLLRKLVEKVLPGGKDLKYFSYFISKLKNKETDLLISIGLPFSVHLAVAVARCMFNLKAEKVIFDYGDPYSQNPIGNYCFYASSIEKWALNYCDYILTPVENSIKSFESIAPSNCKIRVIPQGFKLNGNALSVYKKNTVPTFCYAGILYKGIREPNSFIEHLSELKEEFNFIVFTDTGCSENLSILKQFPKKMRGRIQVKPLISRNECLKELSKMDFLVNFANEGGLQQPSKLVDYTLSKRPFITIRNRQDNFSEFDQFFGRNYSSYVPMDISKFDQNKVVDQILSLVREDVVF